MTYCLAILVNEGIALASDSRSNAGVDYVSSYRKLHQFETAKDRTIALLSAGSLATTQEVVAVIRRDLTRDMENLNAYDQLFEIAAYVGRISQAVQRSHQGGLSASGIMGDATFILGGQIRGEAPKIYMVYPQGNFIEASADTPYLQIGESKYGKPVLDRIATPALTLRQAIRLALLSLDATVKSNVTVGLPFDLGIYRRDSFLPIVTGRLNERDPYYEEIRSAWHNALLNEFLQLPDFTWPTIAHQPLSGPLPGDLVVEGEALVPGKLAHPLPRS